MIPIISQKDCCRSDASENTGPVVRINPDEIHVSDPSWIDAIYTGPGPVSNSRSRVHHMLPAKSTQIRDKYPPSAHLSGVPLGGMETPRSWAKKTV